MNSQQQLIITNARKRALRERLKREGEFSREDLLGLRVSIVPWWSRLLLTGIGTGCTVSGIVLIIVVESWIAGLLLIVVGFFLMYLGIFSGRRSVDTALDSLDITDGVDVVDSIFDSF